MPDVFRVSPINHKGICTTGKIIKSKHLKQAFRLYLKGGCLDALLHCVNEMIVSTVHDEN